MKGIVVQKYGGTSVKDTRRIMNAACRVVSYRKKGYDMVVVVSALGDTTDELIELSRQITEEPVEREMDMLLSTGEQISIALLAMAIHKLGYDAISFTGTQVGIVTDTSHTKARIIGMSSDRIKRALKKGKIVIVAGFQGQNQEQDITTLGRGGSDMTAVALAKVLRAKVCEIYTDVDGVYTADPRVVSGARKLDKISYDEMLELASLGAQVMQARSIEVAKKFNIPIHVRSSLSGKEGTWITKEERKMEEVLVSGVTANKGEAKVTICAVPDKPGLASKIFTTIAKADINVDMIIQNVSRTGRTDLSFTVPTSDLAKVRRVAEAISKKVGAKGVMYDKDIAKVSVVGVGMRSHTGVAAKMFGALAEKKVNIGMISTSEIKISCVVKKSHAAKAVQAIHKKFQLGKKK